MTVIIQMNSDVIEQTNEILPPSSRDLDVTELYNSEKQSFDYFRVLYVCNCFASLYGFVVCSIRLMGFRSNEIG